MITGQKDLPRPPRKENKNVQKNVNIVKIWYYISLLRQIITKKKNPKQKTRKLIECYEHIWGKNKPIKIPEQDGFC